MIIRDNTVSSQSRKTKNKKEVSNCFLLLIYLIKVLARPIICQGKITKKKDIHLELDQGLVLKILTQEDITVNYINWLNSSSVMELTEQNNKNHDLASTQKFVGDCFANDGIYLFGIFYNKTHSKKRL